MTPTPHTDLKPGDVVFVKHYENGRLGWSAFTIVKVLDRRVTVSEIMAYSNLPRESVIPAGFAEFHLVDMTADEADKAMRRANDSFRKDLHKINRHHTDRIMKLIGDNQ